MRMSWLYLIVGILLGCGLWGSAQARSFEAERLANYLQPLVSLQGHFTQELLDGRGQRMQHLQGQFMLQQPASLYWETQSPYPEILISNGTYLWLYDPDLYQARVQPVEQQLAQTPLMLLLDGEQNLEAHFALTWHQEGSSEVFTLRPLTEESLLEILHFTFVDGQISALGLVDSLGQTTRIHLLDLQVNQPIDPAVFEWVPPVGVELMEQY